MTEPLHLQSIEVIARSLRAAVAGTHHGVTNGIQRIIEKYGSEQLHFSAR